MSTYKLLTPGPLTVSDSVRAAMDFDHCTWDDEYKQITQDIRQGILDIAQVVDQDYTCVLVQGSGTYGVEALIDTMVSPDDCLMVIRNGVYGDRIKEIADYAKLNVVDCPVAIDQVPDLDQIDQLLIENPQITHVIAVHSETTTGLLNPIEAIADRVKAHDKIFFADTISSFGGIPIDFTNIDGFVGSSNKCIQGVPGFAIVVVKRDLLADRAHNASTLSLDLYGQNQTLDQDHGKWRFTSPTHSVVAFNQALKEFKEEGGVTARHQRYAKNQEILSQGLKALGFKTFIPDLYQGPIITTFLYPEDRDISFQDMYDYIKSRGYVIYPGKLTDIDTFRIGNIGEIYPEDMEKVIAIMKEYLEGK
ncbi:2-aminoethylphosphonate--pyruvate aminotransferase [Aerococcus urinaehominis]|uniref:2-aminoethylphosphonate--pyruvate transaminase n=1 Tax=Aerococcus urinaehominis TaxID=128944 RepID=A0A109RGI4_9LACT|nr:2-aminoethylphosphonate--pyruvate transaminase [Aerococcus urinaehominis]AMB98481.1 2-aminoethylphosphonate--pyruvate aminotransferase [Aerococcus urinaehominis]SDL81416.1 2-aminoethylphosphonate-pyruvate transaminase [Aerococcus urinaehominis]